MLSSVILSSSEVFEKSKGGPLNLWMHFRSWANSVQILDKFFPEKLHSAGGKTQKGTLWHRRNFQTLTQRRSGASQHMTKTLF